MTSTVPDGFLKSIPSYERIRFDVEQDGIGVLTLDAPQKLNAFDKDMLAEVRDVIWRATFDDRVKGLIVTGEGRAFSAGRDIGGLQFENGLATPQYRAYVRANHETFDDIEALEKPVIAAVNGVCAGGGIELAVACDLRVAAEHASFLLPETQLGVIPASGAASRMIQMIGIGRLKEMIMTGDPIDAREAYRIGLVNRVASGEDLLETARALLRRMFTRAPQAIGMAKHVINACQNVDTETGRLLERLGQSVLIRTEDAQNGMAAFVEKRELRFQGS